MASYAETADVRPISGPLAVAIADPAPLGLAAFALTTFVLSSANAGWIPAGGDQVVLGLAFAYGGLTQLIAGIWEFRRNNTFGATAFCSYGGFWIAFALLVTFYVGKIPAPAVSSALGFFLLSWAIFTAYMTVCALKGASRPVQVVFVLLTITFVILSAGAFGSAPEWSRIGGYFGVATAFAAWYASAMGVMASMGA